ncbi:MAG: cupin domain-containing protein [Deltaproteobacteria bacterium]|nr:cupin domain-containing protein [Deltaproteobacteria bacterium]
MEAKTSSQGVRTVAVRPTRARPAQLFALATEVLLWSGALAVSMACHEPGDGPREQVHFSQDQVFLIVEGTYRLIADDQTRTAGPGTLVLIPRDVVHRFENVGTSQARMLDWSLPSKDGLSLKTIGERWSGRSSQNSSLNAPRPSLPSPAPAPTFSVQSGSRLVHRVFHALSVATH